MFRRTMAAMDNEKGCSPPGLRERKKQATRAALRDAAVRLVLERGLSAVTVEDVAAAADVSPRTFFNYFATKEEALLGRLDDEFAPVVDAVRSRPSEEGPLVALRAALPQVVDAIGSDRAAWRVRMEVVAANPQLAPRLVESFVADELRLAGAIAERTGLGPEHPYPLLVAAHVMTALRVTIAHWARPGGDEPLLGVLDGALANLAAGLPAPVVPR